MTNKPIEQRLSRRDILKASAAIGMAIPTTRLLAQQETQSMNPTVWLDMDQTQLDDAYNQRIYAPNIDQLREQSAFNNELARARLEPPLKFAY